jgi:serine/threonine protein kinase
MQRTPQTPPQLAPLVPEDLTLPLLRPPVRHGSSERSIPDTASAIDEDSDMNLLRSHSSSVGVGSPSGGRGKPRSARSAPLSDNEDEYEELTPSAQLLLMQAKQQANKTGSPASATPTLVSFVPATISFTNLRPKKLKRLSKYVLGPMLGEGHFGHVRDAIDLAQACPERVAVKTIRRKLRCESDLRRIEASLQNEIDHLQRFHHPNVIRARDIFCRDGKDYLVLPIAVCSLEQLVQFRREEVAIKQTLSDRGSNISFAESCSNLRMSSNAFLPTRLVQDILFQLLSGVEYLHKQGIAHNDLKPANILLYADGVVKITDLGNCANSYKGRGTAAFVSPEAARAEEVDAKKSDVWCCGIVLYYLLTNMVPFRKDGTEFQLYQDIANKEINFDIIPESANLPPSRYLDPNSNRSVGAASGAVVGTNGTTARSLLRGMLEKDQTKRMSVSEALDHPWLRVAWEKSAPTPPQSSPASGETPAPQQRTSGGSSDSNGSSSRQHIATSAGNLMRAFDVKDIAELMHFDNVRHMQFVAEVCYIVGVPLPGKIFATPAQLAVLRSKWLEGCVARGPTDPKTGGKDAEGSAEGAFVPTVDRSLFGLTDLNHYSRKGYPECDVKSLRVDQLKKAFLAVYLETLLRERGFYGKGSANQRPAAAAESSGWKCACSIS